MSQQRLQLTWYNKDMALIPTETGRYGYSWVDPSDPRYCETRPIVIDGYVRGEQAPKEPGAAYSERADLEPQADNLMVLGESGDVLEALTRVPELAERYLGRVKLVYIDPPFNTSQTFESYEDNLEHSIWLTMMRDRLLNLKRLMSDDSSIWVHLDDAEVHRMRCLLDEVFGSGNCIAEVAWEKTFKPRNDAKLISGRHDVILAYRRDNLSKLNKLPRTRSMEAGYSNPDNDLKGRWTSAPLTASGGADHQGMVYGIQHPITEEMIYPPIGQHWRLGQQRLLEIMLGWNEGYQLKCIHDETKRAEVCAIEVSDVRDDVPALVIDDFNEKTGISRYEEGNWPEIYITSGGKGGFRRKTYLSSMEGRAIEDLWFQSEVGSNDEAKNEIKALFPGRNAFSTPKPERLLERVIHIATDPGDIVLDCFGGSGTTAAVAQKMGRRWVTCELLESTFETFTKPRLEKVVRGEDTGGITRSKGERVAADGVELPNSVSADDAARFASVLTKLVKDDADLKSNPAIKKLKQLSKTKNSGDVVNWRGGGGFAVAHLAPACFDYDPEIGRVVLTDAATGGALAASIAANLGFERIGETDGSPFDGRRGRTLLKVFEGIADAGLVDSLVSALPDGCSLLLAATAIEDGVRERLRRARKGSRAIRIPDEVFPYAKGGAL